MTELEHSEAKQEKSSFSSRYTLESKLGTGGMGVVYKGYDNVLNKTVAIKVLLPNSQADAIIRFHQEAKMTARLSHVNILTVLDFGQNEAGDLYLVMDFLDGESLHERLKSHGGSLPLSEAHGLFLQICAGLQHAHSQGILHRDIKPSNIMLVKDERDTLQVKIVDFGLAKVEGAEQSLTMTGMRVGSPLYMSPEQAQTDAIDQRSDIYSLGCLIYKTLTGRAPLFGETFLITLNMHVTDIPKSINDVNPKLQFPSELGDIVAKTLEKDPGDRFQSCGDLAEALLSLDLSFLSIAPPAVPLFEESSDATATQKRKANVYGVPINLISCVIALIICLFISGKALVKLFERPEHEIKLKTRDLITDNLTVDVLTDKLICNRDGSIGAYPEFGDDDMHELLRFKDVQTRVSLANSSITGKSFAELRKMKKLDDLSLNDTKIDDEALKPVGRLKRLKRLNLDRDRIGDIGLGYLSKLQNLEELRCEKTLVTILGIETLPKLGSLRFLDISGCPGVSGACLDVLSKMPSLRALHVVQCPNLQKTDIDRFVASNRRCALIWKGKLQTPQKEDDDNNDDPKVALLKKKKKESEQRERDARPLFMQYKTDMQNPKFFRFFQDPDCWKPRKSYDDIKNPRIVQCLKDEKLREVMKDPETARSWRKKETWVQLQQIEDRMKSYLPTPDYSLDQ